MMIRHDWALLWTSWLPTAAWPNGSLGRNLCSHKLIASNEIDTPQLVCRQRHELSELRCQKVVAAAPNEPANRLGGPQPLTG
jgi:hypothetical protein